MKQRRNCVLDSSAQKQATSILQHLMKGWASGHILALQKFPLHPQTQTVSGSPSTFKPPCKRTHLYGPSMAMPTITKWSHAVLSESPARLLMGLSNQLCNEYFLNHVNPPFKQRYRFQTMNHSTWRGIYLPFPQRASD